MPFLDDDYDYMYPDYRQTQSTPGPMTPGPIDPGGGVPILVPNSSTNRGTGATPAGRPSFNFGKVPQFVPPGFVSPTLAEAQQEPGFQFRLKGGADALERSAAARGTLRSGQTLTDLTEFGQNFAAQEYSNVFNRALQAHDRRYRGAYDAFAPLMAQWKMLADAEMRAGLAQWQREGERESRGSGGPASDQFYDPMPVPPDSDDEMGFTGYTY